MAQACLSPNCIIHLHYISHVYRTAYARFTLFGYGIILRRLQNRKGSCQLLQKDVMWVWAVRPLFIDALVHSISAPGHTYC